MISRLRLLSIVDSKTCEVKVAFQTDNMNISDLAIEDKIKQRCATAKPATRVHATRLMNYDCAWTLDEGHDVRLEISMIKADATGLV